ncbi:MAG: rod-binding protein [Alphaproteobacteria bacterium]|nr:rod-binding protein [Alphaproteobacteria bacterium]
MIDAIPSVASDMSALNLFPVLSGKVSNAAGIDAAAQDFEAMFATQLLKPMFDTVPVNSMFGGGNGEEVMRSFLLQEYGKLIAKTGALGIAPQVKAEMIRAQEQARGRSASGDASSKTGENKSRPSSSSSKGSAYVASK